MKKYYLELDGTISKEDKEYSIFKKHLKNSNVSLVKDCELDETKKFYTFTIEGTKDNITKYLLNYYQIDREDLDSFLDDLILIKEDALSIAKNQLKNHEIQLSGSWSINPQDFCKENNLDYNQAAEYEFDMIIDDNNQEYFDLKTKIENQIGKLTPEQAENLYEYHFGQIENQHGYYFWHEIVNQLETKMEE